MAALGLASSIADLAADLGQGGHLLGLARLEQLLNTGKTLGDIAAGDAAGVEGTHGQLGAGLADGLGGDDADRLAGADRARRWPGSCRSTWRRRRCGRWQVSTVRILTAWMP